jgi:hypothetical protein
MIVITGEDIILSTFISLGKVFVTQTFFIISLSVTMPMGKFEWFITRTEPTLFLPLI